MRTRTRPQSHNPFFTAADAAPQDDEPDASVNPAPRSQMRMSSVSRARGRANWTFVRLEGRMGLDEWPEPAALGVVQAVDECHAVRVADGDGGHAERGAVRELERDADDLAVGSVHRDLRRAERGAAHLDRHEVHPPVPDVALALDEAALRLHREGRRLRPPVIPGYFAKIRRPLPDFSASLPSGLKM